MIFVTVGTTKFPFNRLFKIVDEILIKLNIDKKLIVQAGSSDYKFKYSNIKIFKEINFQKMLYYIEKAEVIISHAGPATIYLCWQFKKNPLIFPRLKKYDEHVDDHQLYFAEYLKKRKKSNVFLTKQQLKEGVNQLNKEENKINLSLRTDHCWTRKLVDRLVAYSNSL